jgi:hypothetical protein
LSPGKDYEGPLRRSATRVNSIRPVCELAPEATVRDRLHWLASREAEIITEGDPRPRMHS